MIFVSMSSDELLARTAQYQIVYSPSRLRPRLRRQLQRQPSQRFFGPVRSPLQALERTILADPEQWSDSDSEFSGFPAAPASPSGRRRSSLDFRITTGFDDRSDDDRNDEENDEPPSTSAIERMHLEQIEAAMLFPEDYDSDSDDNTDEMVNAFNSGHSEIQRRVAEAVVDNIDALRRRRLVPSLIEPTDPFAARDFLDDGNSSSPPEVMKPHARFFIEKEKSMVSIKFDPPAYVADPTRISPLTLQPFSLVVKTPCCFASQ
jgi:hypothetical protein